MADREMPVEVRSLAGTLRRWRNRIVAWHRARVSNGPTEALNNLIKRIKRVAFGMRTFRHYRIRVLLYAGHLSERSTRLKIPIHPNHPQYFGGNLAELDLKALGQLLN
jgi:hypothetical protein